MLEEEKINENESASTSVANSADLTTDETLAKLEDFRCAICQKIIINACRIDCGHTFCRHCLNVDKENRTNGTKATCFICDAAITEIKQNAEIDKEIEDLYAKLPTNERLSRARAKSERKVEEENFSKRPKERNDSCPAEDEQSSNETFGSGDAPNSSVMNGNSSAVCSWDNSDIHSESPPFYGATFRVWHGGNDYDYHQHPDNGTREFYSDEQNAIMNGEGDMFNNRPPMVIHHTIQHVYHTVQVRDSIGGESDEESGESSNGLRRRQSEHETEWEHLERVPETQDSFTPRNHSSFQTDFPYDTYHHRYHVPCAPLSYQISGPGSAGPGFSPHPQYHHQPYYGYPPYHSGMAHSFPTGFYPNHACPAATLSPASHFCHHEPAQSYCPTIRNIHATTMNYNNESPFSLHRHEPNFYNENASDDEESGGTLTYGGSDCFGCDGLCEFHQREREQRTSNESIVSAEVLRGERSHEMLLSPCSQSASNNAIHFVSESLGVNVEGDLEGESDLEDPVITLSITVPVRERHAEALERRSSSPRFVDFRSYRDIVRE